MESIFCKLEYKIKEELVGSVYEMWNFGFLGYDLKGEEK